MPGRRVDRAGRAGAADGVRRALGRRLRRDVRGDVAFDTGTRAAYATDSSNYRQVPLGVVFPRDAEDVEAVLASCRDFDAPVLARGGGTSLAGQACNVGVVVDMSRYCNRVVSIDPQRRSAVVEPGVVLDDLRAEAERHGLTFGPDPATHAWCTLGGMIGNNSCGTHALYAGKTVDNVSRLRVLTYDGARLDVGPTSEEEWARKIVAGGRIGEIYKGLRDIRDTYADAIRVNYPDIPRRVSGYNLDELLPEHDGNVARALVGTESTCVLVTEATLRLVTSPRHRRLVVIGYRDIFTAADQVPDLLGFGLLGLECFDEVLIAHMRRARLNLAGLSLIPPGGGWLICEVGANDPAIADARAAELMDHLPGQPTGAYRHDDPATQQLVWRIRESGLGATAHPSGEPPNYEGWEDAAVPPERVGEYLRRVAELWGEYGYRGAWYGHVGQGCVHTRNNFELSTVEGLRRYRSFVERAADICVELGGSLSGEHGDGQARAELLGRMFGPDLVRAFGAFKAVWDPAGRMNPGKVVDPYPLDTNLRHGPDHDVRLAERTHFSFPHDDGSLRQAASRCVGVGRCRRTGDGVMCPSYRATSDEVHSTRGRAKLLEEMYRGEVTPARWRNRDVKNALDLCLSCKGCKVECPTGVDMATYKAEFLAHYYGPGNGRGWLGRIRPRAAYALGLLPWAAKLGTRMPRLANAVTSNRWLRRITLPLAGVTEDRPAPQFAPESFRRWSRGRVNANAKQGKAGRVLLWPDTFTDAFSPEVGRAAVATLEATGHTVELPREWACCGRTLYDFGMLDRARATLKSTLEVLEPYLDADVPIVVLEPSCLAVFRDELPDLLADDPRAARAAGLVRSLAEQLVASDVDIPHHPDAGTAVMQPHCHQRAVGGTAAERDVLTAMGFAVTELDAGCCGLAGSFGYRAEHAALSRRIAEIGVLPALAASEPGSVVVADGFSCATQIRQLADRPTQTIAELLAEAYGVARLGGGKKKP